MQIVTTAIPDLLIIEPQIFSDERGYFFESFSQQKFEQLTGKSVSFVQDNESLSQQGVLRGLHFQAPPVAQAKLVRVIKGAVLDVAVDLRKNSPTYGQHVTCELSEENKRQFFVPAGFAHGFLTLKNNTIFAYKCSAYYAPKTEGCIAWNDKQLNINWGIQNPVLSNKDKQGVLFETFNTPF